MNDSKPDKLACALHVIADAIAQLDDKFADSEGHIKLDSLEKVIEAASLLYVTFKQVYNCFGKTFEIKAEGVAGKILGLLLDLLDGKK